MPTYFVGVEGAVCELTSRAPSPAAGYSTKTSSWLCVPATRTRITSHQSPNYSILYQFEADGDFVRECLGGWGELIEAMDARDTFLSIIAIVNVYQLYSFIINLFCVVLELLMITSPFCAAVPHQPQAFAAVA